MGWGLRRAYVAHSDVTRVNGWKAFGSMWASGLLLTSLCADKYCRFRRPAPNRICNVEAHAPAKAPLEIIVMLFFDSVLPCDECKSARQAQHSVWRTGSCAHSQSSTRVMPQPSNRLGECSIQKNKPIHTQLMQHRQHCQEACRWQRRDRIERQVPECHHSRWQRAQRTESRGSLARGWAKAV